MDPDGDRTGNNAKWNFYKTWQKKSCKRFAVTTSRYQFGQQTVSLKAPTVFRSETATYRPQFSLWLPTYRPVLSMTATYCPQFSAWLLYFKYIHRQQQLPVRQRGNDHRQAKQRFCHRTSHPRTTSVHVSVKLNPSQRTAYCTHRQVQHSTTQAMYYSHYVKIKRVHVTTAAIKKQ